MSFIPNYSRNSDKRVKLLLNGTPVSNSTSQSQYARPINLTGSGVTATPNDTLGTFDVNVPGATTNTMANVGTGTGQVYRDTTSNTYNIKTLKAGTNVTITNNADDITLDVPTQSSTGLPNPNTGKQWGYLSGAMGDNSGSNVRGSGMFEGWLAVNTMTSSVDSTNGAYLDWTTGSTSTNNVSYSSSFTGPFMRKFNPNMTVKFRVPDISSNRFFIGFTDTALPNNQFTFLDSKTGFGLRFDTGQDTSTFKILYNTGLATTPAAVSTSFSIANNSVITANVFADETNARWGVIVNGGTPQYVTTASGAPGQTSPVGFSINYTTQTSAARHFHMFKLYGESDA